MKHKLSNLNVVLLTVGCFIAFFVFGFTDNLKGPTLPAILSELRLEYGMGGNILFMEYLGFMVATFMTGILADRFNLKVVMLFTGAALVVGVVGYSSLEQAAGLAVFLFIVGAGLGALELGTNAIIVNLHPQRKGLFLNLMSVLHGLGSMLAPIFTGWMFSKNISWRTVYQFDLPLIALFTFLFLFLKFPRQEEPQAQFNLREVSKAAFKGILPLYHLAIAAYVAAELGMASWMVTFLQKVHGQNVTASNQALSLFFALLMLGRLVGGFLVQRVGYLRSVLVATLCAMASLAIGLFVPGATIFLSVTGFFMSIIFPTLTAAFSDLQKDKMNSLLSILFTSAGIGGVLGPWLMAWGSEWLGLQAGYALALALLLVLLSSLVSLLKRAEVPVAV